MADDNSNDDQFLTNNSDDTNPMADMRDDEQLPEDNATPFSQPDDVTDDPPTDTGIDAHQQYDAGTQDAAGVTPPSEPAVTSYDPAGPSLGDDSDDQQSDSPPPDLET